MATNEVHTGNLPVSSLADSVVANYAGRTVKIPVASLAALIAGVSGPDFQHFSQLAADLTYADGVVGAVWGDTEKLNGVYKKIGASGSGSWERIGNLPGFTGDAAQLEDHIEQVDDLQESVLRAIDGLTIGANGFIFNDRAVGSVALAKASLPNGATFWMAGLPYRLDSSATGINSCVHDIGEDGVAWGGDPSNIDARAFGFGPNSNAIQNDLAMQMIIAATPDTVEVLSDTQEAAGPWVRYNSVGVMIPLGSSEISKTIVVPYSKNIYFDCAEPNSARIKYTGSNRSMLRFEPRTIGGDYGFNNILFEGGDIDFIGSSNGQIRATNAGLAHQKDKGLWLTDAIFFYDDEYPAFEIVNITKTSPMVVYTDGAHGFANGDRVGIQRVLGMANANHGGNTNKIYAKRGVSADRVEIYLDESLTQPLDATGFDTYTSGGLIGKGYTGAGEGSGANLNFPLLESIEFSSSKKHALTLEASTYAIGTAHRLRFGYMGTSPLVVDCSGWTFVDCEFQGVETGNVTTSAYIWFPMEKVGAGHIKMDVGRFGPESLTTPAPGGDYTDKTYAPPTRMVCFGPLDGSPANKPGGDVEFKSYRYFGENGAATDTVAAFDLNAKIESLIIDGGTVRNIPSGGSFIRETAAEAGRATGTGLIGPELNFEPSFAGKMFSLYGYGWECHEIGKVGLRGPRLSVGTSAAPATVVAGSDTGSGTIAVSAGSTWRLFRLTITPNRGDGGTTAATVYLPFPLKSEPMAIITPGNGAAVGKKWYATAANPGSQTPNDPARFEIRSDSSMKDGTTYIIDVRVDFNLA